MTYKTILVVKNRAMGDSVMGLSTLQYIRELYPDSKIIYALPSWITPLYKNVDISCDEVISFDLKSAGDWLKFYKKIRSIKPDVIFEMHLAGRSFKFFNLYSKIFRIPYFFHNHHIGGESNILDQGVIKAVIQRDLDGAFSCLSREEKVPSYLDYTPVMKASFKKTKRVILGVVATRETKMWPLEYYVELARKIKNKFPEFEIDIPLSTSKTDQKIKEKLIFLGIEEVAQVVHISLENLSSYIGESVLYIGNDTGLKHLAVATGVKSYTLFGPEPPNEWHPYRSEDHPFFYKEPLDCRTRYAHYCGLSTCESMVCLNEFTPDFVFEIVKKELNE